MEEVKAMLELSAVAERGRAPPIRGAHGTDLFATDQATARARH